MVKTRSDHTLSVECILGWTKHKTFTFFSKKWQLNTIATDIQISSTFTEFAMVIYKTKISKHTMFT